MERGGKADARDSASRITAVRVWTQRSRYPETVKRNLDYRDHSRSLGQNRYVYAVASRRAGGLSIGVNMNPDKVCNFDCPYCQVDRTIPGGAPDMDVERLGDELESLLGLASTDALWGTPPFDTVAEPLRHVADLAFSGDGEPTTPQAFPAAARRVRDVLKTRDIGVPMRLITNATMFDRPRVREALDLFDELWCKLDAGTAEFFARVDGTRYPYTRLLENLAAVARERPIVIQSLFFTHDGAPPPRDEIDAYLERLSDLRNAGGTIDHVQVYTVVRKPANASVGPLRHEQLEEIASRVRALGARAEVYD